MNYLFHQTFCKENCLASEKSAFQPAQRLCDQAPFSKASAKVETLFVPTKYFRDILNNLTFAAQNNPITPYYILITQQKK